jgi:glycerol-3-phosphate cytidylyltransferase
MDRIVLTYGTFDLFHIGHLRLLQRLRGLGDRLVVGVSTDEFNEEKGKRSFIPYDHRAEIVASLTIVDETFPETRWDQKRDDIVRTGAAVLGMGDDWVGRFDEFNDVCEVVYLPRTADVSSTSLRARLAPFGDEERKALQAAFDVLSDLLRSLS